MRVLLISLNRCVEPYPVFPLGLGYLESHLRRASHETVWFDSWVGAEPIGSVVRRSKPDVIGISVRNIDDVVMKRRETYYGELRTICAELRQATGVPIVLGGSGFSIFPERLMELSGAEFGIEGEGERSFVELLAAIESGSGWEAIPGLVYRRGEVIVKSGVGLSAVGASQAATYPAELAARYLEQTGMLNVQTQRGCGWKCCYCTYPLIEGRRSRPGEVERIIEEWSRVRRLGCRYVFIVDSVFNSSEQHVVTVCEALIRAELGISWGCFLRPKGLTPDLTGLMARAGLKHVEFGSDSFSDAVLASYGKAFDFEDILRSTEMVLGEKVDCCHFLICGGPGETIQTLEESYRQSVRLGGAVILALVGMRIYPGTALERRARSEGVLESDVDLLEPRYYLAPGLTAAGVFDRLQLFCSQCPSWVVGDPPPGYLELAQRLRRRGVLGPLWSYYAWIQRMGWRDPRTERGGRT